VTTHTHTHTHTHLRIESMLLKWFAIDSDITSLHFSVVNHDIYATPSFNPKLRFVHFLFALLSMQCL